MFEKYPILNSDITLSMYGETSRVSSINNSFKTFNINRNGAELLSKFNGERRLSDIIKELLLRDLLKQEKNFINKFLKKLVKNKIIDFVEEQIRIELNLDGSLDQIVPQIVSLELTEKCNFNCRYCYQNSNLKREKFLKDPIKLLKILKEKNVLGFELTGGEPLLHPQFEEIIAFITANFSILGIITNGSLLKEKHLNLLHNISCKVALQVCLDGNTSEMVEETTGVKGSFEMELNAIRLIKKHGFILRVGMVVDDPSKIDCIEETLLIAKNLGADSFVANPTINFGRGEDVSSKFSVEDHLRLNDKIIELNEKYKGFVTKEMDYAGIDFDRMTNCGCGSKNLTINWDGIMKPCPMVLAEDLSLGHWENLSSNKIQEKMKAYSKLKAPKHDVCKDCNYIVYCYNCIIRGLKASKLNPDCYWVKKNKELIEVISE